MAQGTLEMVVGPKQIEQLNFSETIVIGRDPSTCHLTLDDHRISGVHCRIEESRGHFTFVDLGSANGSFVNGDKVSRQVLKGGELIKLGSFVLMFNILQGTAKRLSDPKPPTEEQGKPVARTVAPGKRRVGGTQQIIKKHDVEQPQFKEGKKFGRFEVLGEIGRGGMGVIYRVKDVKSKAGREYALKALPGGAFAGREVVERFMDEARALARIKQDGVVRIYKIDEQEGTPYYVMDFVDGETLEARLKRGKTYTADEALIAIREVAEIIGGVHTTGLIHRDLTPNNIIYDGKTGKAWLVDFGLARDLMVRERLTRTGELVGTPHYVSPEQAEGDLGAVDRRTDLYALGTILYRMMCGQVPFDGESVPQIVMKVLLEDVTPPRRIDKEIPMKVEAICLKLLSKDRNERYASAEGLTNDIDRYFRGEPIEASELTAAKQLGQAAWKVRLAIGLLGILVAFVLVLITTYAQQIHSINSYRQSKLALFIEGGNQLVAAASSKDQTIQAELLWWNSWETRLAEVADKSGYSKPAWGFSKSIAPSADTIGRLKRLRDAISMYQAALDLDAENPDATKGLETAESMIVQGGKAELALAKKMLERERIQGAIFHALRALEHLPRLPKAAKEEAESILTNAQRTIAISIPGADGKPQKLPVRLLPGDAKDLSVAGLGQTSPFQTRKAGELLIGVGPPTDVWWFKITLPKSVRALSIAYRPLPEELARHWRLAERTNSGDRVIVKEAAYLAPTPLSQEVLTLLAEMQALGLDLGGDPRAAGEAPAEHAAALAKQYEARLPTEDELRSWVRWGNRETAKFLVGTADGRTVVFERVGKALTRADNRTTGQLHPVLLSARLTAHQAAQRRIDSQRTKFRKARAAEVKRYEGAVAQAVAQLGAKQPKEAAATLEKLLDEWKSPPAFKVMATAREKRRPLIDLLIAGLSGTDTDLQQWLEALANKDQDKLASLTRGMGTKLKPLRALFVQHEGRWYASKQAAAEEGALFFDEASGQWLSPLEAADIGWVFSESQWRKADEAARLGHGAMIEVDGKSRWYAWRQALEQGWAFDKANGTWGPLGQIWGGSPTFTELKGDWVDFGLTDDDDLLLLSKERKGIGTIYYLERRKTVDAEPTWKVKVKSKPTSVPYRVLCRGKTIAVLLDGSVRLFDTATGAYRYKISRGKEDPIAISGSGAEVAMLSRTGAGAIDFHDATTKGAVETYTLGGQKALTRFAFPPTGAELLVGYRDGTLALIDSRRNTPGKVWRPKLGPINLAILLPAPKGKYRIVATGKSAGAAIWFSIDGKETKGLRHRALPTALAPCPGNRFILSAGQDKRLIFWDLKTQQAVARVFDSKVAYAPMVVSIGRYNDFILTLGTDGKLRLWRP